MRQAHLYILVSAILAAICAQGRADGISTIRTVAKANDTAPGSGTSKFYSFIDSPPTINDYGRAVFRAAFGNQTPEGIWSEGGGHGLELVAKFDQQAPGTATGVLFNYFGPSNPGNNAAVGTLSMNNAGQVAFRATLKGTGIGTGNDEGLWLADPLLGAQLIGREGDPAPSLSGATFGSFLQSGSATIALNACGQCAFPSAVAGTGVGTNNNQALWTYQGPGNVTLAGRKGDLVPGTTSNEKFYALPYSITTIDAQGHALFKAGIGDQNGNFKSRMGVFSQGSGATPTLVARDDAQAPGAAAGVKFDGLYPYDPAGNSAGQTAWASVISGTGVTTANNLGVWAADADGAVRLVTRKGDPAPGAGDGVVFAGFLSPLINAAGHVAMRAQVSGPGVTTANDYGIWVQDAAGQLQLAIREGTAAPGTTGGAVFGGSTEFGSIAFNALGQLAFIGQLTGGGVTTANDTGLWATDTAGQLHLIAREGTPFEAEPGVFRTHSLFRFAGGSGGDDGLPSGLSDTGCIAFLGEGGGDAVYVSNAVAVPEPSTAPLALVAVALLAAGAVRRRTRLEAIPLVRRGGTSW
jgi:hypothetical protein